MVERKPRRNPSRAARPTIFKDGWWDPELTKELTVAHSDVDRQIYMLNREAYPAELFGRADDLLMFSLFATKQASPSHRHRKRQRHHAVIPEQVTDQQMLTRDEGAKAAKICEPLLIGKDASMDMVHTVVSELKRDFALFQSPEQQWVPCLRQCAEFLFLWCNLGTISELIQVCFTDIPWFTPQEVQWPSARSHTETALRHLVSRLAATYLKAPISRRHAAPCQGMLSIDRLHPSLKRLPASWENKNLGSFLDHSDWWTTVASQMHRWVKKQFCFYFVARLPVLTGAQFS